MDAEFTTLVLSYINRLEALSLSEDQPSRQAAGDLMGEVKGAIKTVQMSIAGCSTSSGDAFKLVMLDIINRRVLECYNRLAIHNDCGLHTNLSERQAYAIARSTTCSWLRTWVQTAL